VENVFKAVHKWQQEAGNLDNGYDDFLQSSFQIEEALEGIISPDYDADNFPDNSNFTHEFGGLGPKEVARHLLDEATIEPLSDVDRFDKHIDSIIYDIGALGCLGLTPQQMIVGILAVNHANKQKLSMPHDELGKLIKPIDFIGPEEQLQKILDQR